MFRTTESASSLPRDAIFESRRMQIQRYGIESLTYLGVKIWSKVPNEIKESASLAVLKNKIKYLRPKLCPCKLCKTYVVNLGYLERLLFIKIKKKKIEKSEVLYKNFILKLVRNYLSVRALII